MVSRHDCRTLPADAKAVVAPLFPVEIGQLRRLLRVARYDERQRAFIIDNRGLNHRPVTRDDVLNILNAHPGCIGRR